MGSNQNGGSVANLAIIQAQIEALQAQLEVCPNWQALGICHRLLNLEVKLLQARASRAMTAEDYTHDTLRAERLSQLVRAA